MALLFLESFDWISSGLTNGTTLQQLLQRKYASVDVTSSTDGTVGVGRHGGTAFSFGSNVIQNMRTRPIRDATVDNQAIIGFALKTPASFNNNNAFLHVMVGASVQVSLRINNSGSIAAYLGNSTLQETSDPILETSSWYYFEAKFIIHDTTGQVIVRLDGSTVWTSAATLDTRNVADVFWDAIQFGNMGQGQSVDDVYICDSSGTANNDFLGDTVVDIINPNANGDNSAWTGSAGGDQYLLCDDVGSGLTALIGESDYISSGTLAQKTLFNYESLPTAPGTGDASLIHGVQVDTWRRITEVQPSDLVVKAKSVATESGVTKKVRHDDTNQYMDIAIFEQDPNASAAWTPSTLNAAQFGVETGNI